MEPQALLDWFFREIDALPEELALPARFTVLEAIDMPSANTLPGQVEVSNAPSILASSEELKQRIQKLIDGGFNTHFLISALARHLLYAFKRAKVFGDYGVEVLPEGETREPLSYKELEKRFSRIFTTVFDAFGFFDGDSDE